MKIKADFKTEEIAAIITVLKMVDMNPTNSTAIAYLKSLTIEKSGSTLEQLWNKLREVH